MDSLSAGAFQEVINAGNDKQFVAMLLQMDEALVGVYHLLQVDILLHDVGKGIFGVIFFIHADDFFQGHFGLHHNGGEDAAREVAAVGDEVNVRIKAVLQLFERLLDFGHMLVLESFVDAHVVVAPAEVARGARFHTAPVLPVMAFTMISSFSIRCLASGSRPSCMQVAKQPDWLRASLCRWHGGSAPAGRR
mgnify:CR=1 FL=1